MALKLRKRSLFPALVTAQSPIVRTKNGAIYVFSLDVDALRDTLDALYLSNNITPTGATVPRDFANWMGDDPYIEDFGGGTAVPDNTAAFNLALATSGVSGIRFRSGGTYIFTTQPNTITKVFRVTGAANTTQAAVIMRNFNQADPTRGLFHATAGEFDLANVQIINGLGFTGGTGVSVIPSIAMQATLTNVRITNLNVDSNQFNYSLYLDGEANTSPLGLRTVMLNNVVLFGASTRACYIKSLVHLGWFGGSVNTAGGSDGSLELTGTSGVPSSENTINIDAVDGSVIFDYFGKSIVNIGKVVGSITNTANTTHIVGAGWLQSGTIQNNWTLSSWTSGDALYLSTGSAINWGNGDVTIVNGANLLSFNGASVGGYTFDNTVYPATNRAGSLGTASNGWSDIYIGGATSGSARLRAAAISATTDMTLPTGTDTLMATTTTQTVTNKSIDGAFNTLNVRLGTADVSGILPVANGGVDQTAWSTYTPTVSAESGTFTTASATGRYKQIGKIVFLSYTISITTVGTGTIARITLPVAPRASQNVDGVGHEDALTGKMLRGSITTGVDNLLRVKYYDASQVAASGASIIGSIVYEAN